MTDDIDAALRAIDQASGGDGLFRNLDEATRQGIAREVSWVHVPGGELLFRCGDVGDALFVVITGRLQAIIEVPDGSPVVVGEISQGEVVGEMSVLTGDPRSLTVRAIRDTTLVKLSTQAFERVTDRNPKAMLAVTRRIIARLQDRNRGTYPPARIATIAVLSAGGGDRHRGVVEQLAAAFERIGTTLVLTGSKVEQATRGLDELAASRWFDDQERQHAHTLYVADATSTRWTARCVRQADRALIVADGDTRPDHDRLVSWSLDLSLRDGLPPVELVLLHATTATPSGTAAWLAATGAVSHHHVCPSVTGEYDRVVRFLTGRAVGLVLGGGGARGFAHIGVIRAFREAGVPIDAVGGTSMGAIIAGQCAMDLDPAAMLALNRHHWIVNNPLKDKTLPVVALLACRRLDAMVAAMFGTIDIPDLWLRYFCVSADLTNAELRIHQDGRLARATRASMSLPGIAIPVHDKGALLIDGGVLNNLPADIMKKVVGGPVVAVNVTPEKDLAITGPYPEAISGWNLLLNRRHRKVPGILSIIMRTTMLASARERKRVTDDIDLLLNPAVEQFGMFDWDKLDAIAQVGYECARGALEGWQAR
ncbi:MAG: cyclic nucleotide-binding and patatin-like phospholipase domain-containing protein [Acidobacteria bacterium]|nr:cyclic nucleotide-binding and patatin-like phospholipase domain-containing protein [Acidobacteriota bacterium]